MRPRYLDRFGIDDRVFLMIATWLTLWAAGCSIPLPIPPTPGPVPPVVVVPVTDGLRVLIVRETAEQVNLPAEQRTIFTAAPFRRFIADNKATLRIWDDDVDAEHESDAAFRKMLEQPRGGLPWIVVAGGRKTVSQPLPKTLAETEALIAGAK